MENIVQCWAIAFIILWNVVLCISSMAIVQVVIQAQGLISSESMLFLDVHLILESILRLSTICDIETVQVITTADAFVMVTVSVAIIIPCAPHGYPATDCVHSKLPRAAGSPAWILRESLYVSYTGKNTNI